MWAMTLSNFPLSYAHNGVIVATNSQSLELMVSRSRKLCAIFELEIKTFPRRILCGVCFYPCPQCYNISRCQHTTIPRTTFANTQMNLSRVPIVAPRWHLLHFRPNLKRKNARSTRSPIRCHGSSRTDCKPSGATDRQSCRKPERTSDQFSHQSREMKMGGVYTSNTRTVILSDSLQQSRKNYVSCH